MATDPPPGSAPDPAPGSGRGSAPDPAPADPFRPFRSRRGRAVALTLGVLSLLVFGGLALLLPGNTPTDAVLMGSFGLVLAVMCWRYATISAVPSREGLLVRNLLTTRHLTWPQVLRVQFSGGAPWVTLDLDDTDQVAVMAIQRADGPAAVADASRLAALVQALGEAPPRP